MIARQDVQYIHQVAYRPEPYEVRTAVTKVGNKSLTLAAEFCSPEDVNPLTRGQVVLVAVDPKTGKSINLPETTREAMNELLV